MSKHTAYKYLLCADDDCAIDWKERIRRRQSDAKALCDVSKPDNGADCLVTLVMSGNALNSILNTAQSAIGERARLEASQFSTLGAWESYALKIYAIIDQMRDQMSEERMKARDAA